VEKDSEQQLRRPGYVSFCLLLFCLAASW